jgi:hypothetical protein
MHGKGGGSTPQEYDGAQAQSALQLEAKAESERQQKSVIMGVQPMKHKVSERSGRTSAASLCGH